MFNTHSKSLWLFSETVGHSVVVRIRTYPLLSHKRSLVPFLLRGDVVSRPSLDPLIHGVKKEKQRVIDNYEGQQTQINLRSPVSWGTYIRQSEDIVSRSPSSHHSHRSSRRRQKSLRHINCDKSIFIINSLLMTLFF